MLKVCVIGMGPIGNLHASIYKENAKTALAGVCDIIPERAIAASEKYGVPYYTDAVRMLRDVQPDLCSITTGGYEYSSDHFEPTIQALEAKSHVLCEKPICNDLRKAKQMVDTAKANDRCLAVNLNHRFTPAAREAKKWQNEGLIGELLFCNMALWIGKFMEFDSEYYHLKALNPHSIDIMRYFCGNISEVSTFAMKASGRSIWSTASVNMRFENNAVGHLTSSYDIARGHSMERCEVAGKNGRLVFEDMWREATLYPSDTFVKKVYTNPIFGGFRDFNDTFRDRIAHFVDEIAAQTPPEKIDGNGEAGLEASRVIHAAIESLKQGGRPIRVSDIDQ